MRQLSCIAELMVVSVGGAGREATLAATHDSPPDLSAQRPCSARRVSRRQQSLHHAGRILVYRRSETVDAWIISHMAIRDGDVDLLTNQRQVSSEQAQRPQRRDNVQGMSNGNIGVFLPFALLYTPAQAWMETYRGHRLATSVRAEQ